MSNQKIISISGNIGVGKTTLIGRLIDDKRLPPLLPIYESVECNPYLDDFYKDPKRWSFDIQIYFLTRRMKDYDKYLKTCNTSIVFDRCVYEDIFIFSEALRRQNLMDDRQYQTYIDMSKTVIQFFEDKRPIDHIFYLRNSSVDDIMSRIQLRGRDCEKDIPRDYVSLLNDLYDLWVEKMSRVQVVDITNMDLYSQKDYDYVVDIMREKICQ